MAFNALMGLNDPSQVGASWQQAFQAGMDDRRQAETQKALYGYMSDPSEQNALAIGKHNPAMGFQVMQDERQRQAQEQEAAIKAAQQHAEQFAKIARWVEGQPDKNAAYQQALQAAHSAGMDVNGAPPAYDPAWVQQNLAFSEMFLAKPQEMTVMMQNVAAATGVSDPHDPRFQAEMARQMDPTKTIPLTQGGGLATYTPGQGAQVVIAPNDGSFATGAPVQQPPQQSGGGMPAEVPNILRTATASRLITPEDAQTVQQSLGPNGEAAFQGWLQQNGVHIGKTVNGQTFYLVNGKWFDNPEGR